MEKVVLLYRQETESFLAYTVASSPVEALPYANKSMFQNVH